MINKGDCINALKLIKLVGTVKHGRNNIKVWYCKCSCGNVLNVDQNSLTKGLVPACKTCRRYPCVICGGKITNDEYSLKRTTCSEPCKNIQKNNKDLKYYSKLIYLEPNHNKERYKKRLADNIDHNKDRYRSFKQRLSEMPEEQRNIAIRKMNSQSNEWRKNWLEKASAEELKIYRVAQRRSYRKFNTQKELAKLMKTKLNGENND